jgi:hypothetical protein
MYSLFWIEIRSNPQLLVLTYLIFRCDFNIHRILLCHIYASLGVSLVNEIIVSKKEIRIVIFTA